MTGEDIDTWTACIPPYTTDTNVAIYRSWSKIADR